MKLTEFDAPGITDDLKQILASWGYVQLTHIQQIALKKGAANGQSLVVSAPTSSGKTLVGEIALLAALKQNLRCIYLVSHKALADQKYSDFENRFGSNAAEPITSVGLHTGDREEGDVNSRLIVATYEKALAMLLSNQIDPNGAVIVADELQIIGDTTRGPDIESLCAVLIQKGTMQFVALTATVGNPRELADWLRCDLAESNQRDVDLIQEIWTPGQVYRIKFGNDAGEYVNHPLPNFRNTLEVVKFLIAQDKGPLLIFTETRREAQELAEEYALAEQRTEHGLTISEQLDLFSEPTESAERLSESVKKQVAFHSADLTPQEKQVIEGSITSSQIKVCFATSTLAAGVNFPFRTVIFAKLTYDYTDRRGTQISLSDYRNMSGRAGRLGLHNEGLSILLPRTPVEISHSNRIVLPENARVDSQLVKLSMRRSVLMLVSSSIVGSKEGAETFFRSTFFWHQIAEHNPAKLQEILISAGQAIDWLVANDLIENYGENLVPTPVGKAISETGLLPTTALSFLNTLKGTYAAMEQDFDIYIDGLIYWVCGCDEFLSENPSRYLPYPSGRRLVHSEQFWAGEQLISHLDRTNSRLNQCAHAISLFCAGQNERTIRFNTNITSGNTHRLAIDVSWVLDGLKRITSTPSLGFPQTLTNKLGMLSKRIKWGAPAEALDLIRVGHNRNVPGFGRQRAMALLAQGFSSFTDILSVPLTKLIELVRNKTRAESLVAAIGDVVGQEYSRSQKLHESVAQDLGIKNTVQECNEKFNTEYEGAIIRLLEVEQSWQVRKLDDGKAQNEPDIMVTFGDVSVIIECKTATKKPPLVSKEDAWAVLQKAGHYDKSIPRITLGKPGFDETCKKKAAAASDITLVEHSAFMEGLLRVHAGAVKPMEFLKWLSAPGLAEIDRLSGLKTYEIALNR